MEVSTAGDCLLRHIPGLPHLLPLGHLGPCPSHGRQRNGEGLIYFFNIKNLKENPSISPSVTGPSWEDTS